MKPQHRIRLRSRRSVRVALASLALLATFIAVGNLTILAMHRIAHARIDVAAIEGVEGVDNLRRVDAKLWAGANPSRSSYQALADAGVTTVVDLRAEDDASDDDALIRAVGLSVVHLPTRDGQIPGHADIQRFLDVVRAAPGTVFVHCGAGVGRTGSMTSAYLVATDQASARQALGISLAVGPPSLEQLAYISELDQPQRPSLAVVALSRVLDAPRRLLSRVT